jgi:hypothetical protein
MRMMKLRKIDRLQVVVRAAAAVAFWMLMPVPAPLMLMPVVARASFR